MKRTSFGVTARTTPLFRSFTDRKTLRSEMVGKTARVVDVRGVELPAAEQVAEEAALLFEVRHVVDGVRREDVRTVKRRDAVVLRVVERVLRQDRVLLAEGENLAGRVCRLAEGVG